MSTVDEQVSRLARVQDPSLAEGEGARELLAAITAEEPVRERRSVRRLVLAAAATAVLTAAAVIGPSIVNGKGTATSYANSAIDIRQEGGEWVARIKDPFANPAKYEEAFRAVGLTVSLQLQPSSPHGVGEIFQVGTDAGKPPELSGETSYAFDAEPGGCAITDPECTLVLRMSVGSTGLWIKAGRPAKPGEAYQDHAGSAAEDGQLAGAKVYERTVGEVLQEIEKRGLTATYLIIEPNANLEGFGVDPNRQNDPVGPGWVVWDAEDAQAGVVRLLVTEKRYAKNPVYGDGSPPGE